MCCAGVCHRTDSTAKRFRPDVAKDVKFADVVVFDPVFCLGVRLLPSVPDGHPRLGERDACKAAHAHDGHERDRLLVCYYYYAPR